MIGKAGDLVGGLISTGLNAFDAGRRVKEEALMKIAVRAFPDSYRDYIRLKAVANKMVFPILESGALGVNPTDADVELARQAMFDVKAPSSTWAAQLNDLNQRHGGQRIIEELAAETGNTQNLGKPVDMSAVEFQGGLEMAEEGLNADGTKTNLEALKYGPMSGAHGSTDTGAIVIEGALLKSLKSKVVPKSVKLKLINEWQERKGYADDQVIWIGSVEGTIAELKAEFE